MGFEVVGDDEAGKPVPPAMVTRIVVCTHLFDGDRVPSKVFKSDKTRLCRHCGFEEILEGLRQGILET